MPSDFFGSGFGCDTETVVHILAHRNATQRGLIQQEYRTMYSGELVKRLSSELSGNVKVITEDSLVALTIVWCNTFLSFIDYPSPLIFYNDSDVVLFPFHFAFLVLNGFRKQFYFGYMILHHGMLLL